MADKTMISVRVDVTKIDKAKIFEGKKGKYLDLILIETPEGKYGDFMVKQESTKEERAQRVQLPILGNAKYLGRKSEAQPATGAPFPDGPDAPPAPDDDCPF